VVVGKAGSGLRYDILTRSPMEILFEPSEYRFLNAGDSAMTQVAISRFCSMWPKAEIRVLTSHPELLPDYSPRVSPLANAGRLLWLAENLFPLPLARARCKSWSRSLSIRQPEIARRVRDLRYGRPGPHDGQMVEEFLTAARNASVFVVAGMGGITSAFHDYTVMMLDTLALVQALKVPTVLFGQGIGPLDDDLRERAADVLRKVDYIALREGRHGPALLRAWAVPEERWSVTGDDAVELALGHRRQPIGRAIGVNLRVSNYSAVSEGIVAQLREPLLQIASELGAPLRVIPISRLPDESDAVQVERLLDGYARLECPDSAVDSPLRVIEEIGHCRIVITGSYHAGVFALSQGIPVIGLAASDYYQWKFDGLTHQFGEGCRLLRLDTPTLALDLRTMFRELWDGAADLRPVLLSAAERQQRASRSAYAHVGNLLRQRLEGPQV
jgi:polysaccharide pyruvyl transferase WcaK-like protein